MSLLSPQLEAFVAVARHQAVHAAARHLGLTQTGVTQRIRALESSLQATLFTRSRKGMTLTREGEALLRYCQAARDLEGDALARIQHGGAAAEVRVCVTGPFSAMRSRVIPASIPVMKAYPGMALTFNIVDLDSQADDLRAGTAQLGILPRRLVSREMDSKLLRAERFVLVGPAAWKKRPVREIIRAERIIDFDVTDQMTFAYLRTHGLLEGLRPERHFVNNTEALVELLEAGLGYGVLSSEFAAEHVKRGSIAVLNGGKAHEHEIALAWYPRPQMPEYFRALINAVK